MFTKIAFAAASIAAAVVATAPAGAATFTDGAVRSVTVSYIDLDLTAQAGRDALGHRIRRAAASVCGAPGQQLDMIRATDACRVAAVEDAQASMAIIVASNDMRGGTMQVAAR
jgi:UrcA family protein